MGTSGIDHILLTVYVKKASCIASSLGRHAVKGTRRVVGEEGRELWKTRVIFQYSFLLIIRGHH